MKPKMLLPNYNWLKRHGYGGLTDVRSEHPEAFAHIPQDYKGGLTAKESVTVAENLAKAHGGKLPNYGWLKKNGHGALTYHIRKFPELFDHLNQERKHLTDQEAVDIIEGLAKENGGKIPCSEWLKRNGHNKLNLYIRNKAYLFTHLRREYKGGLTDHEAIDLAEKLAKENDGKLPNSKWLENQKNEFLSLSRRIRKKRELFAHIPQERLRATDEEMVVLAETLAKKTGEVPNCCWLLKHGHGGLYSRIRTKPHLFKHLKLSTSGKVIA